MQRSPEPRPPSGDARDVLILSTIEGHYSIARGVAESLQPAGLSCHIAICPDRVLIIYRWFYRHVPSLLKVWFHANSVRPIRFLIELRLRRSYTHLLFELLARYRPRILINTNYAFEPSITHYRDLITVPYINVVSDPRTYYRPNLSRAADVNCVFDHHIAADFHRREPGARTLVTGWFVRSQFSLPESRAGAKAALGLGDDAFTILVATGSEGSSQVMKILAGIGSVTRKAHIIVACANNESMRRRIAAMGERLSAAGSPVTLVALPFTPDIHLSMQAADLVVGKAGPNMLFESVAAGAPFLAVTHVHGQEDGNLDIIRDYSLGFVEENPWRARALLRDIIEGREALDRFSQPILSLARRNGESGGLLSVAVRRLLAPSGAAETGVPARTPVISESTEPTR